MFGSGKAKELESRLITTKMKLEEAEKEGIDVSFDQCLADLFGKSFAFIESFDVLTSFI